MLTNDKYYKGIDKYDNHNDTGWMRAKRWYRGLKKAYKENDKQSFLISLNMRDKELFFLSEKETDNVLILFNWGVKRFNLGEVI
jgi:hypothetical protein